MRNGPDQRIASVSLPRTDKSYKMKWFTLQNDKIEGPFSTETLLRKAETEDLSPLLIWGPLQVGWKPFHWWQQALPHLKSVHSDKTAPEEWYMVKQGRRLGPFSKDQLLFQLKALSGEDDLIAKMLVWTKGLKKWTQVIEMHELMNELGLDMRRHPRAKLVGKVTISFQGQTYSSSLKSISEGGLGAEPIPMVYAGEEVQVMVDSDHLGGPFQAKAEVCYANPSCLGLKFLSINSEHKSSIITYVKSRLASHQRAA